MVDFGASEAGKLGGQARAASMSKEKRAEQARKAAVARWGKGLPVATHGDPDHPLVIGKTEIPCYVLEDGTRVVSQRGLQTSVGMNVSGGAQRLLRIVGSFGSKGVDTKDLESRISSPLVFMPPKGPRAHGYEATVLADFCEVVLAARDKGALATSQMHVARQCELLMRGFARVGIIALVDEATGYQRSRERDELAKILEAFVAKEIQQWIKTFDLEFYELMCELRKEPLARVRKRPPYFGKLTTNLVYQRLAPGVLDELNRVNPVTDSGSRKRKHHQHLTPDIGHPKLKEHLAGVTTAMKMAKFQGLSWEDFLKLLDKTHPKWKPMPLLDHTEAHPEKV